MAANPEVGYFNDLLANVGLSPIDVLLLRHKDTRPGVERSPYELWRDARPDFEIYQSTQAFGNRTKFARAPYWASFVVSPDGETVLAGLYNVRYDGLLREDRPYVHDPRRIDKAGTCDVYDLQYNGALDGYQGELVIDWGAGARAWIQRADRKNKPILRNIPFGSTLLADFPNFLAKDLAEIEASVVSPTSKKAQVDARLGQGRFKADAYVLEKRCRVTGITHLRHLRASHIKPWRDCNDEERLDGNNGLLLAPHIDHLFDQGYISFSDDGGMLISPRLDRNVLQLWSIPETSLTHPFNPRQAAYMEHHRRKCFKFE